MACVKTLLFAFVALSLSLIAVAQAAQPTISHNAAVRRHASLIQDRPARRSIAVSDGKMIQKRQTAEQLAQAAALKQWDDDFHAKNAEWQQAAIAALAQGQTPPTYDQYWADKSGSGSSSSSSSSPSAAASTPAPAQQQQQQDAQPSSAPAASSSSSDNNNSSDNSDNSQTAQVSAQDISSSDDCAESDDSTSATSTDVQATSSANGAAAAAATGSKQNAAKGNSNNSSSSSSSSSSSQATSGNFNGQATYYAPGLGACGWTNSASDYIVAISHSLFDSFGTGNPNNNPACGHKIQATYQGKTITVSVADRCEGCAAKIRAERWTAPCARVSVQTVSTLERL